MVQYLNLVGGAHAAVGAVVVASGALVSVVPVGLALSGLYDCAYTLSMFDEPKYWGMAFDDLRRTLMLAALVGLPCVTILAVGGIEAFAGLGILRRWPTGRTAGFVAAAASLVLGPLGMALGIGTIVVLIDAEVRREFTG